MLKPSEGKCSRFQQQRRFLMRKTALAILVGSVVLAGCATNKDYQLYAETQAKIAQAEAMKETARYAALAEIAKTGDPGAKVAAAMSLGFANNGGAGGGVRAQPLNPPRSFGDTALQWTSVLLPSLTNIYGINANRQVAITQSNNQAAIAQSTNNTFASMNNNMATSNTAIANGGLTAATTIANNGLTAATAIANSGITGIVTTAANGLTATTNVANAGLTATTNVANAGITQVGTTAGAGLTTAGTLGAAGITGVNNTASSAMTAINTAVTTSNATTQAAIDKLTGTTTTTTTTTTTNNTTTNNVCPTGQALVNGVCTP